MPLVSGRIRLFLGLFLTFAPFLAGAATTATNAAGMEFFERKIRPLLVDNCYKCHSHQSEKVRGGLMLDTRDGLRQGGDTGPSIIAGRPEKSLLYKAVTYTDKDLQMPPKDQKLAEQQIEDVRLWIKMGAPDPRTAVVSAPVSTPHYWAFQPVIEPALPKIHRRKSWIQSPVDAFVLENLNAKSLKPSAAADKRTLIRRATFDLTGLPPTPPEVADFVADKSKDAFAKVVDRLLASPRYGERWGRYWLDVARYADSKGATAGAASPLLPYAYTYRDYVVRAFNEDLPYNQFILEQLAADQLPADPHDNRSLAAMGFLTVGRQFLGNQNDVIDDRIDVVTRGLLGLTVTCARCHDHKFDPIPTRDYYSLHGVFNSSQEPTNLPLLTVPLPARYTNYLEDLRTNEAILHAYVASNETAVLARVRGETGDYLLATHDAVTFVTNTAKLDEFVRSRKLNKAVFLGWKTNLASLEKTNGDLFAPWFAFSKLSAADWPARSTNLANEFAHDPKLNRLVAEMFAENFPTNLAVVAANYDQLFGQVFTNTTEGSAISELQRFVEKTNSPANPSREEFAKVFLFDNTVIGKIKNLQRKIVEVDATDPGAPPRAMVLRDRPFPANSRIFLRGNPGTPGAEAPREFIRALNVVDAAPFPKKASGRLQLAEDIVNPRNPLTARVFVNRVWQHHFGAPLVATPSDFGARTPPPVQKKLLDYLAARFMAEGWSVKKLHRLILLSSVYQQSSAPEAKALKLDPDNDYLWRMNPQRLDFEAMRDSVLDVAGELDETMGGQPVDITTNAAPARRTIYGLVDRENLPGFFRTFDFANPDVSSAGRFETIVAPQALFLLNSPLLGQCAHGLVQRGGGGNDDAKIRRIYQILFQRDPTRAEVDLGKSYIASQPARDAIIPEPAAWEYGWGTVDETANHFTPLPIFNGYSWRTKNDKTDAKLGPVQLTAVGGTTGRTNIASVRRWIAPRDGHISITGKLAHNGAGGKGLRGWIISSRSGVLGQWVAHHSTNDITLENIEVKANDTIDFAVDNPAGGRPDSYKWAPIVEMAKPPADEMGLPHVWEARENFVDPKKVRQPLGPWEKYAQVLLFSNEFFFIE